MKDRYWAERTARTLGQQLSYADVSSGNSRKATKAAAIAYVTDELKDCSLEDIADLVVHLVVVPLKESSADRLEDLQEEIGALRNKLRGVDTKLQTIMKEQKG